MKINKSLFNKISNIAEIRKKRVIDIETLEWFDSITDVARKIGCSVPNIHYSILLGMKAKGRRFEYLEVWKLWTNTEKEQHTRKNNIYFY